LVFELAGMNFLPAADIWLIKWRTGAASVQNNQGTKEVFDAHLKL
jgi:hypothetical protein